MAKKKFPTVESAIKSFEEAMQRASLSSYYHVNTVMLSKNSDGHRILVIPDHPLWLKIIDDEKYTIDEPDRDNADEANELQWFHYGDSVLRDPQNKDWISIDVTEELFSGKLFNIKLKGREYDIPITRDLMPMKLRKSEYTDVSYRVFTDPLILAIKKRFEPFNPEILQHQCEVPKGLTEYDVFDQLGQYGFIMIRLFQVI